MAYNNAEKRNLAWRKYYAVNGDRIRADYRTRWPKRKARIKELTLELQSKVYEIIPNKCYYESEYCSGALQWDHKYGDGADDPQRKQKMATLLRRILNNPDRWMRLCRLHNRVKTNLSKNKFEAMILQMAGRIDE